MVEQRIEGPRGCTKADLPELIELVNAVFRPDGGQNMLTDYPLVYRDRNLPNIRLLKVDGQLASEVPFCPWPVEHDGCRFMVGIISPTATHPDHRHKGFALRCLNNCIACMEQQGIDLSVLWTMVPTFKFYNHAGYQAVRDQGLNYPSDRKDAPRFADGGETVVTYDPKARQYLPEIMALHASDAFGIVRDADQTTALLALGGLTTLLALRRGAPTAYLCFSSSLNKPGFIEAGGDKAALETLLHHALTTFRAGPTKRGDGGGMIRVYIQSCPTVLGDLLSRRMPDRRVPGGDHMMVRINDIPGFLKRIAPWLERRRDETFGGFSLGITDAHQTVSLDFSARGLTIGSNRRPRHLELSRLELTSALFGAHPERPYDPPEPLASLFPFYFPISVLDRS